MTECPHCGNQVPEGEYCGACGAHLATGSVGRPAAFVPHSSEHVFHPSVISTLFPHLPRRHGVEFRLAVVVVAVVLAILGVLRLTGPAIAFAAAGVPFLYVLYLYAFHLRGRDPLTVIALTFGVGIVLGIPWALITGPLVTQALLRNAVTGVSPANLLLAGVILPVIAQFLMLVGALILFVRWRHRGPLDGFCFGAAGALGFTLATTLINLGPEMQLGLVGGAPASVNTLEILGRGLLIPFLDASTTGLIAAALWLTRLPTRSAPFAWMHSLLAAVVVALAVRIVLGILDIIALHPGLIIVLYLAIAALLLLWIRVVLHTALLAQQPHPEIGAPVLCRNCHRWVPSMAYCAHCGTAMEEGAAAASQGPGSEPPYRPATEEEIQGVRPRLHPARHWGTLAGAVVVMAVILGGAAVALTPIHHAPCRAACAAPPPPCLGLSCPHTSTAPPLRTGSSYTSSAFGYSLDYTEFSPSSQDDRSVEWDLSSDVGQYTVVVTADRSSGRGAGEIVNDVVSNNFPDYSLVYSVPGAEVGYAPGAGGVYDEEVAPFFGSAADTRLVVLAAVRGGLAIAVVGDGDASGSSGDHPDPSGLPVSSFVDSLTNGTRWPGQPPL